jgi:beta-N-acetylhexosaminidase
MVTHILNPQLDPKLPTSLSPNVVTGMLRKQLNFNGVIISDTLWMGGVSNTYNLAQAAVLAVKAGTDLLLGPRGLADAQNMIYGLHQAVASGQISQAQIDASVARILTLKMHYKIISHARALQLARAPINGETTTKLTYPGMGYTLNMRGEDVDVLKI